MLDSLVAAFCLGAFVTLHFSLVGRDLYTFCQQSLERVVRWLHDLLKAQPLEEEVKKKARTDEALLELRRSNYVLCARVYVHIVSVHVVYLLCKLAWTKDRELLPQLLMMVGLYVQHVTVGGNFWQPKPGHIRWMSLTLQLELVIFIFLGPRWLTFEDAILNCKYILACRLISSMVFIDAPLNAVCQSAISVASIYQEMAAGRSFLPALMDDLQVYVSILGISMALEWLIRSRLEALLETEEAETMLESFRKMLRAVCDGALLLDSDLRIQGSHESLKHLLMTSTNLHGKDVLRYVAEDERQSFQTFLEMSADSNQKSGPDVATSCLRVSLCGTMNSRVPCDVFHIPIVRSSGLCHLLALREDAEGGSRASFADPAPGHLPNELVNHRGGGKVRGPRSAHSWRSGSSTSSLGEKNAPVEDMVLMLDPKCESMQLEQAHVSFSRSWKEGMSLRQCMKPEKWEEVRKTLMGHVEGDSAPLRLHLRFLNQKFHADAHAQRYTTPTGQVKIRLHLVKLRFKGSRGLEDIHE